LTAHLLRNFSRHQLQINYGVIALRKKPINSPFKTRTRHGLMPLLSVPRYCNQHILLPLVTSSSAFHLKMTAAAIICGCCPSHYGQPTQPPKPCPEPRPPLKILAKLCGYDLESQWRRHWVEHPLRFWKRMAACSQTPVHPFGQHESPLPLILSHNLSHCCFTHVD
jgi:hypothetical protein